MKKFLSLVLALVMTMSLVTIGAGATEYKDLTDKGEVQYEEAVAVLNKLGIITGYEDGSFKPTGALTRGAAAKIIVSLMIGSQAAANLTVAAAPYKDVATTNTFAGVISYCKTAGYINGYADGTFRPTASLTGYAFAKMLLGALGYDGVQEGFTGSGWTMNVAKLGNSAGLFSDFATAFKGNDGVTREGACLLALNTLKATEVEYNGGSTINTTTGNANTTVVTGATRSYKTSNNTNINANINKSQSGNSSAYLTLEFGEEHFSDLKLDNIRSSKIVDDYGCPANQWSYKNVKIGTYAKTADYTYTADASGDTNVDKVKDMGLNTYSIDANTTLYVNGKDLSSTLTSGKTTLTANADLLVGYVTNGTTVKVYLDDNNADLISNIAVIETQVVKINRVTSKDVTFSRVESSGVATTLNAVKDDDDCYAALKDLKTDAYVVVTPLYDAGTAYDVDAVFIPTTANGNISKVKLNGKGYATGVTVGGTDYKMSFNWTAEDANGDTKSVLNASSVSTTQKSTMYMDSFGYVIYAEDVKASTDYILFDEIYTNVVDSRIHYFAQGWDMKGNTLSLDLGTKSVSYDSGKVYAYSTANTTSDADYKIGSAVDGSTVASAWKASKTSLTHSDIAAIAADSPIYFSSDVKYIFITWKDDTHTDVDTITVKNGAQEISVTDPVTSYQYVKNDAGTKVTAVIINNDADVEVSQNVMYVQKETYTTTDSSNKTVSIFTAYIDGVKTTDLVANKRVAKDTFYTYSKDDSTGIYSINSYGTYNAGAGAYANTTTGVKADKATSIATNMILTRTDIKNNAYIGARKLVAANGTATTVATELNMSNATVVDLRDGGTISSAKDMAEATGIGTFNISIVYNDSASSSSLGRVSYVFITSTTAASTTDAATPVVTLTGDSTVLAGASVTLTATVANAADCKTPLAYQWTKNNVDITGATSSSYTFTADATATYNCKVTNTDTTKTGVTVKTGNADTATTVTVNNYALASAALAMNDGVAVGADKNKVVATWAALTPVTAGVTYNVTFFKFVNGIESQVGAIQTNVATTTAMTDAAQATGSYKVTVQAVVNGNVVATASTNFIALDAIV